MLFLDFDGANTFLHTVTTSLRALFPRLPLVPFRMNWAMSEEACTILFVCTCICWACDTAMFRLNSDLTVTDLLTISTCGGAVAPRCPLRQLTVNGARVIIAVTFMFQLLVHDAGLTWEGLIQVALSTSMLWRHLKRPGGNDSTSTARHAALTLNPIIFLAVNWAREGITVRPAIHLLRARVATKFVLNHDVPLLLLCASTT
jgi:hypothetical protein